MWTKSTGTNLAGGIGVMLCVLSGGGRLWVVSRRSVPLPLLLINLHSIRQREGPTFTVRSAVFSYGVW